MYRNSVATSETYPPQQQYQQQPRQVNNGVSAQCRTSSIGMDAPSVPSKIDAGPDLLIRAFNEALRPHQEKVDHLEAQLADMQAYIDSLEQQRSEMFSWIDKRGLRPGTFGSICSSRSLHRNTGYHPLNSDDRHLAEVNGPVSPSDRPFVSSIKK